MNKKVAFLTLGCKVNSYETQAMRTMFEASGFQIVDFKDLADVYVINTCTVTNMADRKSRQMLHQAKKRNPNAVIAAVGCYAQVAKKELEKDSSIDLIVGNNKKCDIVNMVKLFLKSNIKKELVIDINSVREYEKLMVASTMEKTRAFIKIQDGCNRFCSYCIIPYVRGRVRSRDSKDIIAEITNLTKLGYKEFVMTGIHISSYGSDLPDAGNNTYGNHPLAQLISKVSKIPGIERIRLGSLEPGIITEKFVRFISGIDKFCPHFHLSLQSGSDSVLRRMNRKYTSLEYYEKVMLISRYFEQPAFTTDVIVGFPGESDEEFIETIDFVKKVGFSHIHVFKYSKRAGTKAASMTEQVPEQTKALRSSQLLQISEQMSREYNALFMGRIEKILIEDKVEVKGKVYYVGHNERYVKLAIASNEELANHIVKVKVNNTLDRDMLFCEIIH